MANLVILDHATSTVHYYNVPLKVTTEEYEEYITKNFAHHLSNCSWMVTNGDDLEIIDHTE